MEPLSVILIVAFVGGTVLVVAAIGRGPVSYTHLTLPTNREV